jgi:hypothetical protein
MPQTNRFDRLGVEAVTDSANYFHILRCTIRRDRKRYQNHPRKLCVAGLFCIRWLDLENKLGYDTRSLIG